jgi:histidine triad (HIT) family protein
METLFDKILSKGIPAQIVYEDDYVLCFKDIQPQAPIHWLVIPKKKIAYFSDLASWDEIEVGQLFARAARIAKEQGLEKDGFRLVINEGSSGGQTVFYLHIHILAGRNLSWPPG